MKLKLPFRTKQWQRTWDRVQFLPLDNKKLCDLYRSTKDMENTTICENHFCFADGPPDLHVSV